MNSRLINLKGTRLNLLYMFDLLTDGSWMIKEYVEVFA